MLYKPRHIFRIFIAVIFFSVFFLRPSRIVFPAEDINSLIAHGEEALVKGDYGQAFLVSKAIIAADPRNLTGYLFALIYCVMTNRELGFYKIVEDAKKQGISELMIDRMAAQICFLGGQRVGLDVELAEYEKAWRKIYDPSY
jgi:hypothetical protein